MKKNSPFILLLLLLVIFFYDILFLGKTLSTSTFVAGTTPDGPYGFSGEKVSSPFTFDVTGNAWINEPNPYIIKGVMDEGSLPLWNPSEGLGMPLVGNLNTEVFNPLKVLLNLCPSPVLQDVFFLLRLFILGMFTYLFLREMKLSHIPSLLGGSFFMLSGYSIWWINLHPLSTAMYLPAVFYFYERWNVRSDRKSLLFAALFFCFSIFGGKLSEIITGVTLLFFYGMSRGISADGLRGLVREAVKLTVIVTTGLLLSAAVFLPFYELHAVASPIAKAIRTGASSHTLPLLSSLSLWQPLFLGGRNYFYASWFNYEPRAMLMYAGMTVLVLFFYAQMGPWNNGKVAPFTVFSLLLFLQVYGLIPYHFVTHIPVFRDVNYLKYNGMIYFSLSVLSAHALERLMTAKDRNPGFFLALGITFSVIAVYYFALINNAGSEIKPYLTKVFIITQSGLLVIGVAYLFLKNRRVFGSALLALMLCEFFVYMPKDHPQRYFPYRVPTEYASVLQDKPYRIVGDNRSVPPLVSNASGFSDVRGIDVLIPHDYYIFFQNLVSFSVPYTNSPDALVAASSPFIDLLGVKHILSSQPLDFSLLPEKLHAQLGSLRWIRLFDAMEEHNIRGGASFGFFKAGGEERFSFFFPLRFRFTMTEKVKEPFLFAGFTLRNASHGAVCDLKIMVNGKEKNLSVDDSGGWTDQWIDVSEYSGRTVSIVIEGNSDGQGEAVLGNFGFSPGEKEEAVLFRDLLNLRKKEIGNLKYKGEFGGLRHYENTNVMGRAFVLHEAKPVKGLDEVIRQLEEGADFRKTALLTGTSPDAVKKMPAHFSGEDGKKDVRYRKDKIHIKKYAPDEVAVDVESNGGILVLSDLFFPGWKVRVNGREEEIVKAFGLLRGVAIGEGKSEVVFYYRPLSLYAGIIISLATFIMMVVFLFIPKKNK